MKRHRPQPTTGPMRVHRPSPRHRPNPPPRQPQPPRQISVLVITEEPPTNPSNPPNRRHPQYRRPPTEPEHHPTNHIPPIPVPGQPHPPRLNTPALRDQHPPSRPPPRLGVQRGLQRGQPPSTHHRVVIKPTHKLRIDDNRGQRPGVPDIARQPHRLNPEPRRDPRRPVRGGVVDHHHPMLPRLRGQSGQTGPKMITPPPGDHHHRATNAHPGTVPTRPLRWATCLS